MIVFSDIINKNFKIDIDFEEIFQSDYGNSTIIPVNKTWKCLGIQLSGGLDSALLLYLTALTFKKHNLKIEIQPITIDLLVKIDTENNVKNIINKVRELTGYDHIKESLFFKLPEEISRIRRANIKFFKDTVENLYNTKVIDFEFNGNTKNPPEDVRKNFINDDYYRHHNRDSRTTVYNGTTSASPHALMSKKDIVNLYVKFEILDQLSSLTVSCNENIETIIEKKLTMPCKQCWWCNEREWGFKSNNAKDLTIDP